MDISRVENDLSYITDPDMRSVQAILIGCRLDLQTLRREIAPDEGAALPNAALSLVEKRLRRLVNRLETATSVINQKMTPVAQPAPVMTGVLSREADHRIKNSLQIVTSLLEQQARKTTVDEVRAALRTATARLYAVSEMHAALDAETPSAPQVELPGYLTALCNRMASAFGLEENGIALQLELAPLTVSPERARMVGLIVNELAINAIRHAFTPGLGGTVLVTGRLEGASYELCVQDDGKGLPAENVTAAPGGFGLRLVKTLAAQLGASMAVVSVGGLCYRFVLPIVP